MTVVIVCGPPGSGKTTWVSKRMRETDVVVDLDLLGTAITMKPPHRRPAALLSMLIRMRERLITDALQLHRSGKIYNVWIVTGAPKAIERERLQQRCGEDSQVIVFEISPNDCIKHIQDDESRGDIAVWKPLVRKWWDTYEPGGDSEKIIRYESLNT